MGDSHRFDLFAKMVSNNFPNRQARIVDVAGGKGFLKQALIQLGYKNVITMDKNRKAAKKQSKDYKYGYFSHTTHERFDCVCAMHPDEATDHAILYAVTHKVPAFVCPCCIKPDAVLFNQNHKFNNWVDHLKKLAKGMDVQELYLRMSGRNLVLKLMPIKN
jgi:hypothetical protein